MRSSDKPMGKKFVLIGVGSLLGAVVGILSAPYILNWLRAFFA